VKKDDKLWHGMNIEMEADESDKGPRSRRKKRNKLVVATCVMGVIMFA